MLLSGKQCAHDVITRLPCCPFHNFQLVPIRKCKLKGLNKSRENQLGFHLLQNRYMLLTTIHYSNNHGLTMAKCLPIHERCPTPNGKYMNGFGLCSDEVLDANEHT